MATIEVGERLENNVNFLSLENFLAINNRHFLEGFNSSVSLMLDDLIPLILILILSEIILIWFSNSSFVVKKYIESTVLTSVD